MTLSKTELNKIMEKDYSKVMKYVMGSIKIPKNMRDEAESFLDYEYVKYALRFDPSKGVSFGTYIYKNLRPALINHLEREKMHGIPTGHHNKKEEKKTLYNLDDDNEFVISSKHSDIRMYEMLHDLFEAVNDMDNIEKDILTLILLGYTKKEIAQMINMSYNKVCTRIRYIKEVARKIIID